jgi:hypothetical protein
LLSQRLSSASRGSASTSYKLTQIPKACPSSATHSSGEGQLVALLASHVSTQKEPIVDVAHTTAGSLEALQSPVVVHVVVQPYVVMAPPPNENV